VQKQLLHSAAASELSVLAAAQSSQMVQLADLQRQRLPGLEQQSRAIEAREQQVRGCCTCMLEFGCSWITVKYGTCTATCTARSQLLVLVYGVE
jgi:hypothetical protein